MSRIWIILTMALLLVGMLPVRAMETVDENAACKANPPVTAEQVDKALSSLLNRIELSMKKQSAGAAAGVESSELNDAIFKYLASPQNRAAVFSAPLSDSVKAGLNVLDSPDMRIRILNWDTARGGMDHVANSIAFFEESPDRIGMKVLSDEPNPTPYPGSLVESLNDYKTSDGKTIYVTVDTAALSNFEREQNVSAYEVKNGQLLSYPFFQAGNDKSPFYTVSVQDTSADEIVISKDHNTIKLPLLFDNPGMHGRYLVYQFDGDRFVFRGIKK